MCEFPWCLDLRTIMELFHVAFSAIWDSEFVYFFCFLFFRPVITWGCVSFNYSLRRINGFFPSDICPNMDANWSGFEFATPNLNSTPLTKERKKQKQTKKNNWTVLNFFYFYKKWVKRLEIVVEAHQKPDGYFYMLTHVGLFNIEHLLTLSKNRTPYSVVMLPYTEVMVSLYSRYTMQRRSLPKTALHT